VSTPLVALTSKDNDAISMNTICSCRVLTADDNAYAGDTLAAFLSFLGLNVVVVRDEIGNIR